MNSLAGSVTVITGANGGLGRFVTEAFLAAGAKVVGVSRAIHASDFSYPEFHAIPAELSSGSAANKLVADVVEKFGRLDHLVHLIGAFAGGSSVADTDDATVEQMLDANFRPAFYAARAVLPQMRKQGGGRILVVASRQGVEPSPMVGAYSASKAAVVSLVQTIALENKDKGISANSVLPGTMDTPANRAGDPKADVSSWVQPSQVAALLTYLASDLGGQITGAAIPVYGRQL